MFSQPVLISFFLGAFFALVVWLMWQSKRRNNTDHWPVTEATIQTVRKVPAGGRGNPPLDVGDFSYIVKDEYYSGTLMISRSFSTHDALPGDLINQKTKVRYNPRKPEKYSVLQMEIGGFLLDPYEDYGTDVGSIDLNIDKI